MSSSPTSTVRAANFPAAAVHPALKNFDSLPDSAFVPLPVLCALFSCSPATIWRRVRSEQLVAPRRFGKRTTRWSVRQIREELAKIVGDQR